MKSHWFPHPPPLPNLLWRFYDKSVVELWSSQLHKEQQGKMIARHILPWCSRVIQGDYTDSRGISYWLPARALPTAVPPLWPPQLLSPACWLYGDLVRAEKSDEKIMRTSSQSYYYICNCVIKFHFENSNW